MQKKECNERSTKKKQRRRKYVLALSKHLGGGEKRNELRMGFLLQCFCCCPASRAWSNSHMIAMLPCDRSGKYFSWI